MKLIRPIAVTAAMLTSNIPEPDTGDGSAAWVGTSFYGLAERRYSLVSHALYEAIAGGAIATVTFTASNPAAAVNWSAHNLPNGTAIAFINSGGGLPAALVFGQTYYVVNTATNTFGVAATVGGPAITMATAGTGTHTAQVNPNYNRDPALEVNASYWSRVQPTNRWAMFDDSPSTQSTRTGNITISLTPGLRFNGLALLEMDATSARVIQTDPIDGVVYDQTFELTDNSGITTPYEWWFTPTKRRRQLFLEGLLPYVASTVQIILTDSSGGTAKCGVCKLGLVEEAGDTQYNATIGIQDYSIKSINEWGQAVITERAYARRGDFEVYVKPENMDSLIDLLASLRATAAVYIASTEYGSTMFYGFFKDFSVVVQFYNYAVLSIQIEGLT